MNADPLFIAAAAVRNKAHAPFSNFKVGAAVQAADGIVYAGCNVESASYGLTICAERVAITKAISEGSRKFSRIAVYTESDELTPPCGACRQLLWELCGNVEIYLLNHKKQMVCYMLGDLLPLPFDQSKLKGSGARPGIG
ncbi:cytidine deaminase [soil metagenome]